MCGINGIYAYNASASLPEQRELVATRDAMTRRGPDGSGEWWSTDKRLGLGHRRLSIIDLSDRASQPMVSEDGRYTIVFNGEIYNYKNLRSKLEAGGAIFRSSSDTEVLLNLYAMCGPSIVDQIRGMYAFAIWDNVTRQLFLARDPYGIKPLYIADDGSTLRFASQVKALLAGGKVSSKSDPAGVTGFCLFGHLPEPFTMYRSVRCFPAGHSQLWNESGPISPPQEFGSISRAISAGPIHEFDADRILNDALLDSVAAHLVADVEVGLFLSAGIDSGALLGLMKDVGQSQIRTITLGFREFDGEFVDEVQVSRLTAKHYGVDHIVRYVDKEEFREDIPEILSAMDQPSIDGVNTWFVAKAANEQGIKVAISGVGGDELFGGYDSFRRIPAWVRAFKWSSYVPALGTILRMVGTGLAPGIAKQNPKLFGLLELGGTYPGAYLLRRGLFAPYELKGLLGPELAEAGIAELAPLSLIGDALGSDPKTSFQSVAALESGLYLRNQLLRDSDWAGMAHSLEIRTPLVDYTLLQSITSAQNLVRAKGKKCLAMAPKTPLPIEVLHRSKTGFTVPTHAWLSESSDMTKTSRLNSRLTSRDWAIHLLRDWGLELAVH